jgi:beta-galactosidase
MIKKIVLAALANLVCLSLQAALPSRIKIDVVNTRDMVPLAENMQNPKLNIFHPGWVKPTERRRCYLQIKSKKDLREAWESFSFSFTPEKDGTVKLVLMGRMQVNKVTKKRLPVWVLYDNLEVAGARLVNGDFETLANSGKTFQGWKGYNPVAPFRNERNVDSKYSAAVWHDRGLYQLLKLKAGQTVTVTFEAKACTPEMVESSTVPDPQRSEAELEVEARKKLARLKQAIQKCERHEGNAEYEKMTVKVAELFLDGWIQEDRDNAAKYRKFYVQRYRFNNSGEQLADGLPARQLVGVNEILDHALNNLARLAKEPGFRRPGLPPEALKPGNLVLKDGYFQKDGQPVFLADFNWSQPETPLQFVHYIACTPYHVMNADGSFNQKEVEERLDKLRAVEKERGQMPAVWMTLLLPDGLDKKYPGILESDGKPYCKFDIDHPDAKGVWEAFFARVCPEIRKIKNVFGYHLANEPHWSKAKKSNYFYLKYRKFLETKYGTIDVLNKAWDKAYGSFGEIASNPMPEKGTDAVTCAPAEWYDFCTFNQMRVTSFFTFMHEQIKKYHPEARTFLKMSNSPSFLAKRTASRFWLKGRKALPDQELGHSRHCNGIDREALAEMTEINGCDTSLSLSPDTILRSTYNDTPEMYYLCWQEQSLAFDFMKSLAPDKLLLDDEWHVQSTVFFRHPKLPAQYMNVALWLAHVHGMGANEIWHWGRSTHGRRLAKDLIDSLCMQPVALNAYLRGMLTMNAYATELVALAEAPKTVRLLYSENSAIMSTDYLDLNLAVYQAAYFQGLPVGYVTERQLAKSGIPEDCRLLVLPGVSHVTDATVNAIRKAADSGCKVVLVGDDNLTLTPDGWKRPVAQLDFLTSLPKIKPAHPKVMHRDMFKLIQELKVSASLRGMVKGRTAFGVEVRSVDMGSERLVFLANLLSTSQTIERLVGAPATALDLLSGKPASTQGLFLNPGEVRLLKFPSP